MIGKFRNEEVDLIQPLIIRVVERMDEVGVESEEYKQLLVYLDRLYEMKNEGTRKNRVSTDTMWMVVGNLVGILVIVGYEHANVVTSKALGMLFRSRTL